MTEKRVFSNRVIWSQEDIDALAKRLDEGSLTSELLREKLSEISNVSDVGLVDIFNPLPPTGPGPPTPPPPPPPRIAFPWPISIKSISMKNDALGNPSADVTITFPDVPQASGYEVRMTRL